jgi:magnesium transporter
MMVDARVYASDGTTEYDDIETALSTDGGTWIHARDIDNGEMTPLQDHFDIHPLAVEDVLDNQTRPKTEEYETHTFVLMKTARLSQRDEVEFHKEVQTQSVGFFIGDGWLVTMTPSKIDDIDPDEASWRKRRFADRGMDFLAYRMMDEIVDNYFLLLEEIEDDIEAIEEQVLHEPDPSILEDLNDIRRDLLAFRKIAWPAREAVSSLSRGDIPQVATENEKYYRDLYDHLIQVVDLIETFRDLSGGSRDIYLNAVSQSTNEVMKTLTVVATIFIPLTFVAGIYGMNFTDSQYAMPELTWTYGYPAAMLGMAILAGVMLWYFRQQDWL